MELAENTTNPLMEKLDYFFKINPSARLESGKEPYLLTNLWDDETIAFEITPDNMPLIEALNNLIFPPSLSAIYHIDTQTFEFIFRVEKIDDPLWTRNFEFIFNGENYPCKYAESSDRLINLAKASQLKQAPSPTEHRNLRMYRDYCDPAKISPAAVKYFEIRKPMSFFLGPIKVGNTDQVLDLARHLNFYMFYFDRETPQIIIHRPEDITAEFSESEQEIVFPSSIIGSEIDTYMLDLWMGAKAASGRLAFLYYYQMLEYAAFYFIEDQVKLRVEKILRQPNILSSMDTCLAQVVDEIVDYKLSDEAKLTAVVKRTVNSDKVWAVIEQYKSAFSQPQQFDGGFIIEPFIKDGWTADDFTNMWIPKLPDKLRQIRNALVHSRESRMGKVIAPTRANSARIMPWVKVIEEIACQVAIYRNV
ncbi:MAG: hypothetical protein IT440_16580 [Phycisphaeraceae bacterium]|jgi:hypothetical protein|nr:hypothetical protein [Phycisphaeraceae bacterium]